MILNRLVTALTAGALAVLAALPPSTSQGGRADAASYRGGRPATSRFSPALVARLRRVVTTDMTAQGLPGVVVGAWVPGRGTWVYAAGKADLKTGAPMRTDDIFRIASNTKTFTATEILILADRGKLRLSNHLSQYVTGVPYGNQITVRQLLNMTAGVYDFTEDQDFSRRFDANPLMPFTPGQALAIVRRHKPDFAPGQGIRYSDTNYVLLGLIIQKVTGRSPEQAIQRDVIAPLRLSHTSFPTTAAIPSPHPHGYTQSSHGLRDVTLVNPAVAWTAGAMLSTVGDLHVWVRALARGTLVSPGMQRQRLQMHLLSPGRFPGYYGLGLLKLQGFLGHTGAILGFNSFMFYLPQNDAAIIVLTNKSTNNSGEAGAIWLGVAQTLFPHQFSK